MTATVYPIPTQAHALSLARQVIRSPDDHSAQILHDACDVLANGDWLDKQQSRMVRKTLPKRKADAPELVTDVIDARTEPEGSDTPEANKRADRIMGAVILAWVGAFAAWWWLA